jgi:hypothetical protein
VGNFKVESELLDVVEIDWINDLQADSFAPRPAPKKFWPAKPTVLRL